MKAKSKTSAAKKIEKLINDRSEKFGLLLEDEYVKSFLGVNYFEGLWYFSKENFETLLDWLFTLILLDYLETRKKAPSDEELFKVIHLINSFFGQVRILSEKSDYKLYSLLANFQGAEVE